MQLRGRRHGLLGLPRTIRLSAIELAGTLLKGFRFPHETSGHVPGKPPNWRVAAAPKHEFTSTVLPTTRPPGCDS
jgi:hypothetical protein